MNNIWLFSDSYNPNSASTNRCMSFVRGFSELNVKTNVVFIRPNFYRDTVRDCMPNVEFHYLWNGKTLSTNKRRYFQQILWIVLFLRKLDFGEKIIVVGLSELLFVFSWFKKLNIYHERNEYPDLCIHSQSWLVKMFHKLYLKCCRAMTGIFVISEPLKDYYMQLGIADDKIKIINMTVDAGRFEKIEKQSVDEKYIAYCGSVTNYKDGVDTLIKAFSKIVAEISDIKLYIIGQFPFEIDKQTDFELVKTLELDGRVIFTGVVPVEQIPQVLKNAEVLVLARPDNIQAKYGFPTKLGEYLLTSNPVVVTEVGDIPKFLINKDSAYLAHAGDVADIADEIYMAITDTKATAIGECGRRVATEYFNYLKETRKMCDFIFEKKI